MQMRRHRSYCLALIAALLGPAPAMAQTGSTPAPAASLTLPGSSGQTCVQVQVKSETPSPYNCLNQALQQQVEGASPPQGNLPLSENSPSNAVGTFNKQGVSEQYGQNFGKSVIPFRPNTPVYSNALAPPPR